MATITHDFLKSRSSNVFKSNTILEKSLQNNFSESTKSDEFDIFLSHAFLDHDEIGYLVYKFNKLGFSVFVDWIEKPELDRSNVTEKNVNEIRKAMKKCKVLIYAFSDNAKNSYWMPWELGFFDGYNGNVAVLPVTDNEIDDNNYEGIEFISIYPFISLTKNKDKKLMYYINFSNDKYDYLHEWIQKKKNNTTRRFYG